jgi:hypothetical protein
MDISHRYLSPGLEEWLKCYSSCPASEALVQTPAPKKTKSREIFLLLETRLPARPVISSIDQQRVVFSPLWSFISLISEMKGSLKFSNLYYEIRTTYSYKRL